MMLLQIEDLHVHYGSIEALQGVSLRIAENEIVALIGANGAGKSTLLKSICGEPKASAGKIVFQGENIENRPTYLIARRGIAHVPEGRRVFPDLSVTDNILLGLSATCEKPNQAAWEHLYAQFPILWQRRKQQAGTLSGGEQQMLALARAIISRPKLLLLDEPSLGLAPKITNDVFQMLKTIAQAGTTLFVVEQNAYAALHLASRAYVLRNGQIALEGSAQDLLQHQDMKSFYL